MQDALQITRFLAPRGLHLCHSVGNQGTGLLQARQLEMHGFVHNVLDGTERANFPLAARHRNEDPLRPTRLTVTDVESGFGSEQDNLSDRCPYRNF